MAHDIAHCTSAFQEFSKENSRNEAPAIRRVAASPRSPLFRSKSVLTQGETKLSVAKQPSAEWRRSSSYASTGGPPARPSAARRTWGSRAATVLTKWVSG